MNVPHDTIVAVADGEKLSLFRVNGNGAKPKLEPLKETAHLTGSNHDGGSRHHSSAANPDEKQDGEDMFAAATAQWLNQKAVGNAFAHAVVIAAPKTLGELRKHYHKAFAAKLLKEIPKDLTGQHVSDIEHALENA